VLDSFLQLVASFFSTPVVSAESLTEKEWTPKYALEISEETETYLSKNDLLALSNEDLYWVVAVLDGDTLLISGPDRELFQVRLLAVDANEINGPDSTAECYGAEAALFTTEFLKNRAVRLSADPANEDEDPYGRKLRYVEVLQEDGDFESLNKALLLEGYASFPEQYPVTAPEQFEALEKIAQEEGKGMWGACE
jgi:endonuclease YncB( thermonuclease family)